MLLGGGQKIDKLMRRRAKVADAALRRQGSDVEQNAGRTHELHVLIIHGRRQVSAEGAMDLKRL
jgi:hypothetical protein